MIIKNVIRDILPIEMGNNRFPVIVSNIGLSSPYDDFSVEMKKAEVAIDAGSDVISDLSLIKNLEEIQKWYIEKIKKPISAVSVYETYVNSDTKKIDSDTFIRDFEKQAQRGLDLLTLHATTLKDDIRLIQESKRLIPTTSRGGAMMLHCIHKNNYENPYYEFFEDILKIAKKYNVCLSLGPLYRPASVWDCQNENSLHLLELQRMARLVERANSYEVGIAVEGIGHAPINLIEGLVKKAKSLCHDAAYRVLTVSSDIAMGFDHISSAISSAVAVQYGADSITCVTRSEHVGLPTIDDIRESVISTRIAAESGYRARNAEFPLDYEVSLARSKNGCHAESPCFMFSSDIPTVDRSKYKGKSCGMCGDYCPFQIIDSIANDQ